MIKVGESVPPAKLMLVTGDGPKEIGTDELFRGKRVVLFATPGAFTPTCSAKHLPGFVEHADAFRERGIDTLACMAVNDAFVMAAWARDQKVDERIAMLADGSAQLTRAMGLELDLTARGLGVRCQRFALVAENGVIRHLTVEQPGGFDVSRAEQVLASLEGAAPAGA